MINKKYLLSAAAGALIATGAGAATLSFAATSSVTNAVGHAMHGVMGTVTANDGSTVTITGKDGKTYSVHLASGGSITKEVTAGISDLAVGDTIVANGTVQGTSVSASNIHDGKIPQFKGGFGHGSSGVIGRGIHGTVQSISGTTLTVTATNPKDNTTSIYTVDASSATVLKGDGTQKPATSNLAAILVGDQVMVGGSVSGQNVTAKVIIDGPMPKMRAHKTSSNQ